MTEPAVEAGREDIRAMRRRQSPGAAVIIGRSSERRLDVGRARFYDSAMTPYPIRFPPELLERLRAAAREQDRPISTIVRRAVIDALERHQEQQAAAQ